jgi:hypothetical protein
MNPRIGHQHVEHEAMNIHSLKDITEMASLSRVAWGFPISSEVTDLQDENDSRICDLKEEERGDEQGVK